MRTSKIQEFVDFYNSTDYLIAEHFADFSPKMMMDYFQKNSKKIKDVIVIREK